jgi:hypothetical protein
MKKPKRRTKEMVLCPECKKPVHIDDWAMTDKRGFWHRQCIFKVFYQNPEGFLTGGEMRIREHKEGSK